MHLGYPRAFGCSDVSIEGLYSSTILQRSLPHRVCLTSAKMWELHGSLLGDVGNSIEYQKPALAATVPSLKLDTFNPSKANFETA